MELFVGLDVSQDTTHLCAVDNEGNIRWQGKCSSMPAAIAEIIQLKAPGAARIGLESGALSPWLWHALNAMKLPVICLDARHAKGALSMQVNKTDKNDAHGLAQIVRTGWYRQVQVKSLDSHRTRAMLGARAQLVGMRTETINHIRGILKPFGIIIGKARGEAFDKRVQEIAAGDSLLQTTLLPLLEVLHSLREQVQILDKRILKNTAKNKICRHLMTVPGVGPITATAFIATIDDPKRFQKSRTVGAYLGLTPRRYQSGEIDQNGSISKTGDRLTRCYLYEAASVLLTRVEKWSSLKAWGLRIAKRSGMKKAKVAVARKLAIIMHRMWMDGEAFRWSQPEKGTA